MKSELCEKMWDLPLLVCIFTLIFAVAPISGAQTGNVVSIGNVETGAGENVTIPITITNATAVAAIGINLSYVPGIINITGASAGDFVQKQNDFFAFDNSNSGNGWVTINTYVTGADLTGNITLANVTIEAEGNSGESPMILSIIVISDQYGNKIPFSILDGIFKIRSSSIQTSTTTSGGGSGGGGGGISGENFSNIIVKEKYGLHIFKDKVTSYAFTNGSNPVKFVNITGNVSAGEIVTTIEVLKDTSTLVGTKAPGKVYKNINIWVGTSGFAGARNIKESIIKFRLENSWLSGNDFTGADVAMFRWNKSEWIKLGTKEFTKDDTYTYFIAETTEFSPFTITAQRVSLPQVFPATAQEEKISVSPTGNVSHSTNTPTELNLILVVFSLLILSSIIIYIYRHYKKSNT